MSSASNRYRKLAAELRAKVHPDASSTIKAELDRLAECYVRLAEQADRNHLTDLSHEGAPMPEDGGENRIA
jgi:hypothetical protein